VAVLALIMAFVGGRHGAKAQGAPTDATGANKPALQLELGKPDPKQNAKTQAVRCFVNGQLVGMTTLNECAQKNGTASQALDVGLDAPPPGASLTPPPMRSAAALASQTAECLRYGTDGWKGSGGAPLSLGACVRVLFQGQCAHSGEAFYGRWGAQSLRLIPGRVEISDDNRSFRQLVEQDADCQIPSL
jgi:hypothetical protein